MKRSVFPVLFVLCLFITFLSCSNESNRSRKPYSQIIVQPNKQNYSYGEKVSVQVKTNLKNGKIDNIKLFFNNHLLKESSDFDFTVNNIELSELGIYNFKVEATKKDDVSNTHIKTITVVSDIIPEKLTYQTINTFPHNKNFFTQGLEFHNGFLYEGTGEEGQSGIFKIDLKNGDILNSHHLDDEYFGEGITILNDKLYQITYHAQKGFVYNLSNFALIDSFSYISKEGWGFTNDSNCLIMSNGTNLLTWLDPTDYSIIKTVKVANDKGIINNLNELEYIDGTIYANIYTTNLIVQIEPGTGRILSEINLEGIVNMYVDPSETINYLNGIAWDQKSKKLFVTGKWWPRLFEIKLVPSE